MNYPTTFDAERGDKEPEASRVVHFVSDLARDHGEIKCYDAVITPLGRVATPEGFMFSQTAVFDNGHQRGTWHWLEHAE